MEKYKLPQEVTDAAEKISGTFEKNALNTLRVINSQNELKLVTSYLDSGTGINIYEDFDGGRYYDLNHYEYSPKNRHVKTQFFIASLLKGFISVSDIIPVKQDDGSIIFYSYEAPHENFKIDSGDIIESKVEMHLLQCLFNDYDKTGLGHNSKLIPTGGFIFYDFEVSYYNFFKNKNHDESFDYLKYVVEKMNQNEASEFLEKLILKVQSLIDFYSIDQGSEFLEDLFKKTDVKSFEEIFDSFGDNESNLENFKSVFLFRLNRIKDFALARQKMID